MAIQLHFHGAAGGVTGSAYQLRTSRANVLIDCGLFQGGREAEARNHEPLPWEARALQAVLVTHAHLDHTGRLPLLAKAGYDGPVYGTEATREATSLILHDSARVQAQDLVRTNRKRERAGDPPLEPLYSTAEVERFLPLFRPVAYDEFVPVAPGIRARWVEAGHLLGSASIQLLVEDDGSRQTIVFSGDLGRQDAPLLKDAAGFQQGDVVVLESTYGGHDHKPLPDTLAEFESLVKTAVERKSKILIPTFAVGRAQLLLYLLAVMFRQKLVPPFPIYIDSPMAIEATRIYRRHLELFDEDFQALQRERPIEADLTTVRPTPTADESRQLNDCAGPCLILAGSGMCTAGRILHHLKQNLWRDGTVVFIVGFQPEGSLGRQLVDGATSVSIFGEKVAVRARIHTLGGFSAHAGQRELLEWLSPLAPSRPRVILTHGEPQRRDALAEQIRERFGLDSSRPMMGEVLTLRP